MWGAEEPLPAGGSCLLGSFNLSAYVKDNEFKFEEFKRDKQFVFANIATLSTGVDGLQEHCSNMLFLELPPRPSDLDQAKARIDRMGQKQEMNIYYILSSETIDADLKEVIDEKTVITNAVIKGHDTVSNNDESTDWALIKRLKSKNKNTKSWFIDNKVVSLDNN